MISAETLVAALAILNVIPIVLLIFIRLKLARQSIRAIFSVLIVFGMLWGNTVLLSRYDGWDTPARMLILYTNFAVAAVLVLAFFAFFVRFTGNQAIFKKPVFWLFTANTFALVVAAYLGLIIASFETSAEKLSLRYGPGYPWFVISSLGVELYGLAIVIRTYRTSENDLLRYQLRTILAYAAVTFVFVNVMNILLPNLLKNSRFSLAGPYLALFFFSGVFRILFRGARLYVLNALDRLLQTAPFTVQENLFAVREFIQALKAAVLSGEGSSVRRLEFAGLSGEKIGLMLGKNALANSLLFEGNTAEKTVLPQKWIKGFQDTVRVLEEDNRHLALSLIKAETILQEKWLSDTVEKLPIRTIPAFADALAIADYLPMIAKNISDNRETFGVEICTLSRTMFKQMAQVEELSRGNQLIVVEGEPGTGKASMARAISFFRFKAQNLIEIACQNGNIDALSKRIEAVAGEVAKSRKKTGVLIRNMDFIPLEMISIFTPIFNLDQDKTFLYITSAPDYLRNLEGLSDTLFHRLNQVRLQLPPLRRREDDIEHLIFWYAALYAKKMNIAYAAISPAFIADARRLSWQGNIVELQNTIQRELLNNKPPVLRTFHLNDPHALAAPGQVLTPLERAERKVIVDYLKKNNFNKNRTRIELDITVNTLNAKIIKYGIELPE
jgi:N-terminal 7TM region of histidine kinase